MCLILNVIASNGRNWEVVILFLVCDLCSFCLTVMSFSNFRIFTHGCFFKKFIIINSAICRYESDWKCMCAKRSELMSQWSGRLCLPQVVQCHVVFAVVISISVSATLTLPCGTVTLHVCAIENRVKRLKYLVAALKSGWDLKGQCGITTLGNRKGSQRKTMHQWLLIPSIISISCLLFHHCNTNTRPAANTNQSCSYRGHMPCPSDECGWASLGWLAWFCNFYDTDGIVKWFTNKNKKLFFKSQQREDSWPSYHDPQHRNALRLFLNYLVSYRTTKYYAVAGRRVRIW